ncbi:AraC family transcriptional regulator [Akkermansiaceae bacterium]|nr:AraC family transcriptional regulator [Akkermansiaceae bacterium]
MPKISDYESFWDELNPGQITIELMDMLSDTLVYVKNIHGQFIFVNAPFATTLLKDVESILGKTDSELFGKELSTFYESDDREVMDHEVRIKEKAEMVTYRPGVVKWYITSKIPLFNKKGKVVGLAGISRPSNRLHQSLLTGPMASIGKAIEFIYSNKHKPISIDMMAKESVLSVSTLERSFKKYLSCSPAKFVTQVKMSSACELLAEPSYSIGEVSDALGYSDSVVFNRTFKREMKMTPSAYRKSISNKF